jgi:hypothetical protein
MDHRAAQLHPSKAPRSGSSARPSCPLSPAVPSPPLACCRLLFPAHPQPASPGRDGRRAGTPSHPRVPPGPQFPHKSLLGLRHAPHPLPRPPGDNGDPRGLATTNRVIKSQVQLQEAQRKGTPERGTETLPRARWGLEREGRGHSGSEGTSDPNSSLAPSFVPMLGEGRPPQPSRGPLNCVAGGFGEMLAFVPPSPPPWGPVAPSSCGVQAGV